MGPEHTRAVAELARGAERVLEYGSGRSTRMLIRLAQSVVSVESDLYWYCKLCELASEHTELVPVFAPLTEPSVYAELPLNFGPFDLVVVDGRFRCRCLHAIQEALMPQATIVLHDAERPWYAAGKALYETILESPDSGWKENPNATLWIGRER